MCDVKVDRVQLQTAFRLLVQDTEGKYDECLVTRVFDMVSEMKKDDAQVVIDCLSDLYTSENFESTNISRLFKLHGDTLIHTESAEVLDQNAKHLRDRLPSFLSQGNQSCLPALIDLLSVYLELDEGCKYLIERPFIRPVEKVLDDQTDGGTRRKYKITDCLDLIKYCLDTTKNYQLIEATRGFMISIIQKSYCRPSKSFDQQVIKFINELMLSGNHEMYMCMKDLMSMKINNRLENFHHSCRPIIKESFEKAIKENNTKELVTLATIMSFVTDVNDTSSVLELLKRVKNLEAMITFATNNIDYIANKDVLKYIVYPILTKCNTEDAQVLIPKLHITREEGIFIDSLLKDKYLIHCFKSIDELTYARRALFNPIAQRKQIYLFEVILEYLKCHQLKPGAYKNVLQCLSILRYARHVLHKRSEILWLFKFINEICKLIGQLDPEKPGHMPLIVGYIRLIGDGLYKVTHFRNDHQLADKVSRHFMRIIDLAFKYTDCDILNEFVNLFSKNAFQFILSTSEEERSHRHERYVKLVWNHLRKFALMGDHQELLGTLTDLLIAIDLYIDAEILSRQNITKRQDIPKYLGDVLIDYASRIPTVEAVIERLRCATIEEVDRPINRGPKNKMTYLCFLDIGTKAVRDSLDHVIKGLCLAAKGECNDEIRSKAISEIGNLIEEFLINEINSTVTLARLIRTGVLQTLYEITTGSLHSMKLKLEACEIIRKIQTFIISDLPSKRKTLLSLITKNNEECDCHEQSLKMSRIEKVADFYIDNQSTELILNDSKDECESCCEIAFDTYIDQIINQQHCASHVTECH